MTPSPDSPDHGQPAAANSLGQHSLGQHSLGPHVVGTRVVVRRIVPDRTGPTGGPAFTDALGVCTAWGEGLCVLSTRTGEVRIPIGSIVSGKPVPPRAPVRHRVSVREAELHVRALWPDLATAELGEWVLRSTPPVPGRRQFKRANSVLALGDPGVNFESAVRLVIEHYQQLAAPVQAHVELESAQHLGFLAAGWQVIAGGEARFQMASVARALRTLGRADRAPELTTGLTTEGAHASARLPGAVGRATIEGDWLALHGLHTDPELRRRGLARDVLSALLEWGAEQGATTAWLHVESTNDAALGLYGSLGFTTHHTMTYLSGPI